MSGCLLYHCLYLVVVLGSSVDVCVVVGVLWSYIDRGELLRVMRVIGSYLIGLSLVLFRRLVLVLLVLLRLGIRRGPGAV